MHVDEKRLPLLFREYLSQNLSEENRRTFLHLAALPQHEQALKDLIDEEIARLELDASFPGRSLTAEEADLIFERIISHHHPAPVAELRQKRRWFVWAAAAAVILVVSGLGYFRQTPVIPASRPIVITDVAPAVPGAVLTLGDGSRVLLDSQHNGNILTQGNANIIKENGRVIYSAGSNSAAAVVYNTLTTPRGFQYNLTLPDGTKVWLNAASSITYPTSFTGSKRIVSVTGEPYFEVMPDHSHPFIVQYGSKSVEVTGTHFNVNAYDEEEDSRVTLLEGSVKVYNGTTGHVLTPGQQAVLSKTGNGVRVLSDVDTAQVMAWKNGHFDFREADLKTIMRQLMRWYDVEVVYQGQIPARYFTADISRNKNLSGVLQVLALNKIHFRIENKQIIVTP
ncbi:FecR family protein [Sediminibacterium ginsengisoli]|uniref:FecR protein n=1 Tax=Sediminibacterium ginsengisoli TaxID=413434 RepID=A0A1T4LK51_9BACT|nr:FecR family protein [Sediminibacterium ginsengisoli]SJZ54927.1 FecR protein [Sediminibacterium ginsengisoli]